MNDTEHSNIDTAPQQVVYSPSDIHLLVKENLKTIQTLLIVEGVYSQCGTKDYRGFWYDAIKSQYAPNKLTIIVPTALRVQMNDGELIQVSGVIEKNLSDDGKVSIQLRVSSLVGKREKEVDEKELRQIELQQRKSALGYRNVDSIIESILYEGKRKPKVALMFAEASITDQDFKAGIQASMGAIEFNTNGTTFTRISDFIHKLSLLDTSGFDAICLIRGGGSGISEVFENPDLAEAVINMNTPVISAIGHQVDNPLVCKIADKNIGTPSLLGQFFKDMVERITVEKNHSKAVLVAEVEKRYSDQIKAQENQIKALQGQLSDQNKGFLDQRAKDATEMEKLRNQVSFTVQQSNDRNKRLRFIIICLVILLIVSIVFCIKIR